MDGEVRCVWGAGRGWGGGGGVKYFDSTLHFNYFPDFSYWVNVNSNALANIM